jgi:hypothetical protein
MVVQAEGDEDFAYNWWGDAAPTTEAASPRPARDEQAPAPGSIARKRRPLPPRPDPVDAQAPGARGAELAEVAIEITE